MKNSKIVALVATAALLVVGAAMTAFAATGWVEENGTWMYYDKNGDPVTEAWAKSGNDWYWLDENGEMAVDQLIDDDGKYYYVDESGKMVKNDWKQVPNTDDDEDWGDSIWMYFGANGKAYNSGDKEYAKKTINGKKYLFNQDGRMLWGWVSDEGAMKNDDGEFAEALYYCGGQDDGALVTSAWRQLDVYDNEKDNGDNDQTYWFYFAANGNKVFDDVEDDNIFTKTINGKKYTFGTNGAMLDSWVAATDSEAASTSIGNYQNFSTPEDGARKAKAWFRVSPQANVHPEDSADYDDVAHWFYAKGDGTLLTTDDGIKTINGKKYVFDENGEMLAGAVYLTFDETTGVLTDAEAYGNSSDIDADTTHVPNDPAELNANVKSGIYFFGDEETDGSMKTGNVTATVDGDDYALKLVASGAYKGRGLRGFDGNSYYVNGKKLAADEDIKIEAYGVNLSGSAISKLKNDVVSLGDVEKFYTLKNAHSSAITGSEWRTVNGDYVLVTSSGTFVKSGTKTDADGNKYKVESYLIKTIK